MHQVAPLRNSPVLDERRRYVRHKPTSIIYVALGPGNGGILVNLSAGGLFLQAVAKLNGETELSLNFRLEGTAQGINTAGCVTWLGPTQKEAGISFKDLPVDAEQQIADWIASQEQPVCSTQPELKLHPMPAARDEAFRLPTQAAIPVSFPSEKLENDRPDPFRRILREPLPEPAQQDDFRSAAEPVAFPAFTSPALGFRARLEEEPIESPLDERPELAAKHYKLRLEPKAPALIPGEILPRDCLLPDPISPSSRVTAVAAAELVAPMVPDSFASGSRRRRRLAIAVAAGMMGILVLIVTVAGLSGPGSPGEQSVELTPPSAAVVPESAAQTRPAQQPRAKARAAGRSQVDSTVTDDAPLVVPAVRIAVPVREDGFMGHLRSLLGMDVTTILDPSAAALPVWTIQHSGFYYCNDSPNFKTLLPGALMTQSEALQSGYQPKLGTYCQ